MKRNKKLTVIALSVMLVMTLAVTVISFSFAGDNDNNNGAGAGTQTSTNVATGDALTNIDYIVKNSRDPDADIYKIVEIGSKAVGIKDGETEPYTTFGEFAEKGGFKEYVINGNKTIDAIMPDDKINYVYYYAGAVSSENTAALADIASADFIYISNDSTNSYSKLNDFGEDLYNLLHVYAVGDYKPIIIESPADSGSTDIGGGGTTGAGITFDNLVVDYYKKEGYLNYTFAWENNDGTPVTPEEFFGGSGSLYISINGKNKMSGWKNVKVDPSAAEVDQMTEVLVVSSTGTAIEDNNATRFNLALKDSKLVTTPVTDVDAEKEITLAENQSLYNIEATQFYEKGYSQKYYAYKPEYALVSEISFADLQKDTTFNYNKYDLVIFEDDLKGKDLSDTAFYKRLVGAMYGNVHIIFGDVFTANSKVDDNEDDLDVDDANETNYHELFYMVATEDGVERYPNVMVTTKAEMEIIMSSNNAGTCKVIADIINGASYRGIGGPGSTSTMFTVLEIQPCYPVDTTIAAAKGNTYYTTPSEVVNGKTREQLGLKKINGTTMVVNPDKTTSAVGQDTIEYYDWELSEAKVADALGMDVRQVKVVHMSSEEFATNKDEVLGNYDMVYIGGNESALSPKEEWRSIGAFTGNTETCASFANLQILPVYTMYTNVGDMMTNQLETEEGPVPSGTTINAASGHTPGETFVTLNGNDITYNGLEELKEFVKAGMPVIISDDVKAAYDPIKANIVGGKSPYLQNKISPDSNMYDFLLYCDDVKKTNVVWGFDKDDITFTDNDGGTLGDTLTGEVEVFAGNTEDDIKTDAKSVMYDLYSNPKTSKRPKLAVTSMPAVYNVYDPATTTKTLTLSYKFDVVGTVDYEVKLYADYGKNSMFEESEIIASDENVTTIEVNLAGVEKYGPDYSGPVYWKLEITDKVSGASVSTTKLAYVETSASSKKTVRVLQILPDRNIGSAYASGDDGNKWVSLIFCTECQRAYEILEKNPGYNSNFMGNGDASNLYMGKIGQDKLDGNGACHGIYTGLHEHNFGIVRYDSSTTMDDWYYNYADDVSGMFEFDIDIMDSRDFEKASQDVLDDLADYVKTNHADWDVNALTNDQKEILKTELLDLANVARDEYEAHVKFEDFFAENYPNRNFEDLSSAELATLETQLTGYNLALAEYNLKKFILSIKDSTGSDYANTAFNNIYNSGQYEDFVLYIKDQTGKACWHYAEYKNLYETYARALDVRINLEKEYDKANRLAHFDNWLLGCYETVVIGPAESFCGDDIKTKPALNALSAYVDGGGSMLMFHDTLTKYSDKGAFELTKALIDDYGMDKNHVEIDEDTVDPNAKIITPVAQPKTQNSTYNPSIKVNGNTYNLNGMPVTKENVAFTVKIGDNNINVKDTDCSGTVGKNSYMKCTITINNGNGTAYANQAVEIELDSGEKYNVTTDANGKVTIDYPNFNMVETELSYADVWLLPYKLKEGYSSEEYNVANLSPKVTTDNTRFYTWSSDVSAASTDLVDQAKYKYYSPIYAYTDPMMLGHNNNVKFSQYKYATVNIKANTKNGYQAQVADLGSNKASQTNKGIMTMFPFNLSDELNIAPTHPQAYAIDLQNDDLSVWYTIAGGSNNKDGSEYQAATPHDGTDNYFIYSVGNLNYCSAGHTRVTGQNKQNNDERMLYINIICNSVTNVPVTEISAFDYSSTDTKRTNDIVKKYGSEYVMKIDESVTRPSFSFDFNLGNGVTLKDIKVYYELDNVLGCGDKDKLISTYTSSQVKEGKLTFVPKDLKSGDDYNNLEIKPEYLTNGKYVYIVIQLTDSNGNKTFKKIKIEYKEKLYNLT